MTVNQASRHVACTGVHSTSCIEVLLSSGRMHFLRKLLWNGMQIGTQSHLFLDSLSKWKKTSDCLCHYVHRNIPPVCDWNKTGFNCESLSEGMRPDSSVHGKAKLSLTLACLWSSPPLARIFSNIGPSARSAQRNGRSLLCLQAYYNLFFFFFKGSSIKTQTIIDVTILASLSDHYKTGVGDDDSCVFQREGQEF